MAEEPGAFCKVSCTLQTYQKNERKTTLIGRSTTSHTYTVTRAGYYSSPLQQKCWAAAARAGAPCNSLEKVPLFISFKVNIQLPPVSVALLPLNSPCHKKPADFRGCDVILPEFFIWPVCVSMWVMMQKTCWVRECKYINQSQNKELQCTYMEVILPQFWTTRENSPIAQKGFYLWAG